MIKASAQPLAGSRWQGTGVEEDASLSWPFGDMILKGETDRSTP